MKKSIVFNLSLVLFLIVPDRSISASAYPANLPHDSVTLDLGQRDSLILEIMHGWMNFLKATSTATCLPINEAKESELEAGSFSADFFVPAQLGYKIMAEILSYEVRKRFERFTAGFTKDNLINSLECMIGSLVDILDHHAYTHPQTGKKALYQVHRTNGTAPLNSDFDRTVSMLDNAYLITALEFAAGWAKKEGTVLLGLSAVLDQFDMSMWVRDAETIHIGAPGDPLNGGRIDRILTEGRLAPVLALAREEIDLESFRKVISMMRWNSLSDTLSTGETIRRIPYFGTALEIWVPTVILSVELETVLGCESLDPLVYAWEEARLAIPDLPAAGFSGIGNGFGGFLDCSTPPSESTTTHQGKQLLVVPAAFMQAGAMMSTNAQASCNFFQTYYALKNGGLLHPNWGPPNYVDYGSELVNMDDHLRGTLEVLQAGVALMNNLLGGRFIEETLREDDDWDMAMDHYKQQLGTWVFERQAEMPLQFTGGKTIPRPTAFGGKSWYLPELGNIAFYEINIPAAGDYYLILRYSNDDLGVGDSLVFRLGGREVARMKTEDTGNFGGGWSNYIYSEDLDLGFLPVGNDTLSVELIKTDGFGVELDAFSLVSRDTRICDDFSDEQTVLACDIIDNIRKPEAGPLRAIRLYPNPSQGEVSLEIPPGIDGSLMIRVYSMQGQLKQMRQLAPGNWNGNTVSLNLDEMPSGLYIVEVANKPFSKSLKLHLVR